MAAHGFSTASGDRPWLATPDPHQGFHPGNMRIKAASRSGQHIHTGNTPSDWAGAQLLSEARTLLARALLVGPWLEPEEEPALYPGC